MRSYMKLIVLNLVASTVSSAPLNPPRSLGPYVEIYLLTLKALRDNWIVTRTPPGFRNNVWADNGVFHPHLMWNGKHWPPPFSNFANPPPAGAPPSRADGAAVEIAAVSTNPARVALRQWIIGVPHAGPPLTAAAT